MVIEHLEKKAVILGTGEIDSSLLEIVAVMMQQEGIPVESVTRAHLSLYLKKLSLLLKKAVS